MKNTDLKQFFANMFSKKVDSFLIVEIGLRSLTLISVDAKNRIRIDALRTIKVALDKREEIILNAISDFARENNILHKNAILNPFLETALIKRIQLPELPVAELVEAIKWQIKEDIPFDLASAVIEYSVIRRASKEDGSKILDVMCLACREEEIKRQVLLLKQSGFNCLSVSISPFGYRKIIEKYLTQNENESVAILHFDYDICYIAIYKDNKFEFYRELPVSINKLKDSLKGVLVSDKGKVSLSSEETDEILSKVGIPLADSYYREKISFNQILSLQRPVLERLLVEIKRSFSYYDSEYSAGAVKKILVAGPALTIPNIDKFLTKELNLAAEVISLGNEIATSSAIDHIDLSKSWASLALAIGYEEDINLLPYEFRTEKIEAVEKISIRWVAIIAVLLLALSFLVTKFRIVSYEKRLASAKLHLGALSEVKQLNDKVNEMNNFIMEVKKSESPVGIILKKLSNIASNELFFSQLLIDCDLKSGSISGFVKLLNRNPDVILTEFIRNMKDSGYFQDASIANVQKKTKEGSETTEFNINFKLN